MSLDATALIAFEREIADLFNAGAIRAPVHLAGGNEAQLIEAFAVVGPNDWVCCQWRSHYHCLLKGVPAATLKAAIVAGRSIALCFPEHRVISSAIAGGILPIALGLAWQIKRAGGAERVHAFVGDMTSQMGLVFEGWNYAGGHELPIRFIVENNGKSVCTDTPAAWGELRGRPDLVEYDYVLPWPHAGAGKRIQF